MDLADFASESIIVRGMDGAITFWNSASTALYGWPPHAALGRDLHGLLKCHLPYVGSEMEAQLLRDGSWSGELTRTTASGETIQADVRWTVRYDESGLPQDIVECGRNIISLSALEIENRLASHRYRNLFHAMAASFWELDFSVVRAKLGALMMSGVSSLPAYFEEHPTFVRELIDVVKVIDVNEKTVALFAGESREQMIGLSASPFWPAESQHVFAQALFAAAERRDSFIADTRLQTLDGRLLDVLFTVCWPEGHKGAGTVLVGVIDTTDNKRAFSELEKSEFRYRGLFEHMPIALVQLDMSRLFDRLTELRAAGIVDLVGYVESNKGFLDEVLQRVRGNDANAQAVRLFGVVQKEELFVPIAKAWQENPETIRRSLVARLKGAQSYSEETRINTYDGRIVDVLYTIAFPPELMERGINVVGFIDITDKKRAHSDLQRSEERYRNLFHHMPISLWQIDARGTMQIFRELREQGVTDLTAYIDENPDFLAHAMEIISVAEVNQHTVSMFGGNSPADFIGSVARYWPDAPETFRRSLTARWEGKLTYTEETKIRTLDGRTIDVLFSIAFPPPLQEVGMSLIGTLDIGDRVRAEAKLQQIQADFAHAARVSTLGELTASIAHEVNQPLAAITTNGQASLRWLSRKEPNVQQASDLAAKMVADARRASDIIRRIRGMAAKREPEHLLLDLNEVVQEALLFVRHDMQTKEVELAADLGFELPAVRGDRVQLQQVIVNLIINSVQAIDQAGCIKRQINVATRIADDGQLAISVRDTGPGIAAEHIDHVFTGFFSTKDGGMGIGLAICQSIIEAHGGSIGASNHVDGGARFTFILPPANA
ncbi:ATP-binding protein [Sphingomonas oleivorans]|nr:ATP-binding protein [Sphingomonas oleivorans]